MKFTILFLGTILSVNAAVLDERQSYRVVGKPEGFAVGTTGGGNAPCRVPRDIGELRTWLQDNVARCIVLDKEYNFKGSEGTVRAQGCRPASNKCAGRGQDAINHANWCTNGNAGAGSSDIPVTYDKSSFTPINMGSNKSLIGVGNRGVLRGKGLRIANGAKNVIIQNIHITDLNPQYIFGGDAITLAGTDLVWVDHCKISLVGRQMFVAGPQASNRVALTYNEFDGRTSWSANCDGTHYWAIYTIGSNDLITMKFNWIHHTSGRSPKVGGNTLMHAVNNFWSDNTGHAFDNDQGGKVLLEGNAFQNVKTTVHANKGQMYALTGRTIAQCTSTLGRACQTNLYSNAAGISFADASVLNLFRGKSVARPNVPNMSTIKARAGVGKI
ncbi:hypothetical protein J1614_001136 [Plenodomus biglobosus]|nr:hypothetical protein J1614_001136 [Plenodomus biglobosus]